MRYIDLHCDTVTACFKSGRDIFNNDLQLDVARLERSGCAAQCFAIFTDGDGAAETFSGSLDYFLRAAKSRPDFVQIGSPENLRNCVKSGIVGGVLTVESLSFLRGDIEKIPSLAAAGVKICSLVWNNENELAAPNMVGRGGNPDLTARCEKPLTPLGREAVRLLDENKITVDISHLSDGGAREILKGRRIPTIATHSNCAAVCPVSRNLTDDIIRLVADCGGVIGVNFCRKFLGEGDAFSLVAAHAEHILKVGGEGALAFGSDFDGIPECEGLESCEKMPALLEYLTGRLGFHAAEAMAYKNALRVLG